MMIHTTLQRQKTMLLKNNHSTILRSQKVMVGPARIRFPKVYLISIIIKRVIQRVSIFIFFISFFVALMGMESQRALLFLIATAEFGCTKRVMYNDRSMQYNYA